MFDDFTLPSISSNETLLNAKKKHGLPPKNNGKALEKNYLQNDE